MRGPDLSVRTARLVTLPIDAGPAGDRWWQGGVEGGVALAGFRVVVVGGRVSAEG